MEAHRGLESDWQVELELDKDLAGWIPQDPARGEFGWEWGWAALDHQDQDWESEEVPAVSD